MKTILVYSAILLGATYTATADSAEKKGAVGSVAMRDAATHNQLSQTLRTAQQNDPIKALGPAAGKSDVDPALKNTNRDLIKESTVLCYRGFLTLVPKQAVIHLPERLKDRFEVRPGIKVQSWADFYQANRGWIKTVEVTRAQAMGQAPLSEDLITSFETSTSAVIATFKGGPISVLPYKEPEADETSTETESQ